MRSVSQSKNDEYSMQQASFLILFRIHLRSAQVGPISALHQKNIRQLIGILLLHLAHDHSHPFDLNHLYRSSFRDWLLALGQLAGPQFPIQLDGANG